MPIFPIMREHSEKGIPPKRLRAAMESGVLNARCQRREQLLRVYGRWCWRMGLPMVWFEPRSRNSRLSGVHLDLFTTPGYLSVTGRAALIGLSARYVESRHGSIGTHEAVWDQLGPADVAEFARLVFRTVRRAGNCELSAPPAQREAKNPRVVPFPVARRA
jgi:hypothetical protein